MKLFLISITVVALSACETFRGVRQEETSFPNMTPQLVACIENTLRENNQITFIKYEKSQSTEGRTSTLVKFTSSAHYFIYALKKMKEHKYQFQVYVTELSSEDQSRNGNHYNHAFGYINVDYNDEERKIGEETIKLIDSELKKSCLKSSPT